jgi:hypothetical protein
MSSLPTTVQVNQQSSIRAVQDQAGFFAEHDSVIPPPDHHLRAVRRGRDGYQVAG